MHFQSKELEIEIRYRDWRSICAFTVVKLGDIVEPAERAGMVLNLEPQGDLFAEVFVSTSFFFLFCFMKSFFRYCHAQFYCIR